MKLSQIRENRLAKEGFPVWERKKLAGAGIPLRDPALMQLRKERRIGLREAKKAGIGKRAYNRQIGFQYAAEGFRRDQRYRPLEHFERYKTIPKVAHRAGIIRARRETSAGYAGRFKILKAAQFSDFEARILARMPQITDDAKRQETFDSKPWQAMIARHPAYIEQGIQKALLRIKRDIGPRAFGKIPMRSLRAMAKRKFEAMMRKAYQSGRLSPWDFLKQEYRPKKPPKGYSPRTRRKAHARVQSVVTPGKRIPVAFWN